MVAFQLQRAKDYLFSHGSVFIIKFLCKVMQRLPLCLPASSFGPEEVWRCMTAMCLLQQRDAAVWRGKDWPSGDAMQQLDEVRDQGRLNRGATVPGSSLVLCFGPVGKVFSGYGLSEVSLRLRVCKGFGGKVLIEGLQGR